jgi:hypothetical protein
MKVGDLHSGAVKLEQAIRSLMRRWEHTQTQWNDPAGKSFEAKYLADLEPQVKLVVESAARLAEVLDRAQQEVS